MKYEWCYDHEQLMWKNGLKCSGCLEDDGYLRYKFQDVIDWINEYEWTDNFYEELFYWKGCDVCNKDLKIKIYPKPKYVFRHSGMPVFCCSQKCKDENSCFRKKFEDVIDWINQYEWFNNFYEELFYREDCDVCNKFIKIKIFPKPKYVFWDFSSHTSVLVYCCSQKCKDEK